MNLRKWFTDRGLKFVVKRGSILLDRYGITTGKAMARIGDTVTTLARYGAYPTFFTPGIIVKAHTQFIKGLQEREAEIAVHSYQHLDLSAMSLEKAHIQLNRALAVFKNNGIGAHGFRCPYLSWSDELLASIPVRVFGYSSNRAVWLDVPRLHQTQGQSLIFNALQRFYHPESSAEHICLPHTCSNMIEIPVCVPDDLQLHDGLDLDANGISQVWIEMLHQTYVRGELFNLIFHPELGSVCNQSFEGLLQSAAQLVPAVWIAKLCEINDWWREKSNFGMEIISGEKNLKLKFNCSSRATILVRGLDNLAAGQAWDGTYSWLNSYELDVPSIPRPFIGLASSVPGPTASFLREQGYILDSSQDAKHCQIYLDEAVLASLTTEVQIIDYIEASAGPLVRYGRWPNGARSALSITGDLDALSLVDYATRLAG